MRFLKIDQRHYTGRSLLKKLKALLLLASSLFYVLYGPNIFACLSPTEAERIARSKGTHQNGSLVYEVEKDTRLCNGQKYHTAFVITENNVNFDCNGASIIREPSDPNFLKDFGIQITTDRDFHTFTNKTKLYNHASNNLSRVTITSSHGRCVISGFRNAVLAQTWVGSRVRGEYDKNNPQSPFQPAKYLLIEKLEIVNNSGSGINIRAAHSTIRNNVISKSHIGIHIEADSNNNLISENEIFNSKNDYTRHGRSGIILDASYENRVLNNKIYNNHFHGIAIYKNCGEYGDRDYIRKYHANDNLIEANEIFGHRGHFTGSGMTITRGSGIAIGLRQGLLYFNLYAKDLAGHLSCGDRSSHMFAFNRARSQISSYSFNLIPSHFRLKSSQPSPLIPVSDRNWRNVHYYGPHNDFAQGNKIRRNKIYDNAIGVYVADDNNEVSTNSFFDSNLNLKNIRFDIFFGNRARDARGISLKSLSVHGNRYLIQRGQEASGGNIPWGSLMNGVTSSESNLSIRGWKSERLRTFRPVELRFAEEIILYDPRVWR